MARCVMKHPYISKHWLSRKSIMESCPEKKLYLFRSRDMPRPIPRNVICIVCEIISVELIITILFCVKTIEVPSPCVTVSHMGIETNGE
jgi:hypothetical protein